MLNWQTEKRPIIALAPMADMTDSAFCRIAKQLDCRIVFREMVSAEAIVRKNQKTFGMATFNKEERPIVQQLFGSNPEVMAEATKIIDEKFNPDAFDINMGCPANKITGNFNGAALMREPDRAIAIIRAMKAATKKPISVKTRLGWSQPNEILKFIRVIEEAGANLVAIHGRTKEQGYSGQANWEMIGRAKALVSIPVLVNGDIFSPEAAQQALQTTKCEGVLIARGALGNPWIFRQIQKYLEKDALEQETEEERNEIILKHARLHVEFYGGEKSLITFRKHLLWYFKGRPNAKILRERLVKIETLNDLEEILKEMKTL